MSRWGPREMMALVVTVVGFGSWLLTGPQTSATSAYEKQHTLLLVNEMSSSGQAGSAFMASVYTVHGDGTGKTLLTNDGGMPSWTPDGRVIFISNRSGSQQIWIMDEGGSNAHQIGNLSANMLPLMPQMGRKGLIVFMGADTTAEAAGNVGIWIMQKDGSGLNELVRGQQPFLALSGTWITYTTQTDNPYHREIWRINTDGTGLKQLTFLGNPDYPDANASSISPDETMVAFFSGKEADQGPAGFTQSPLTWGHRNVAVIPATGGARRTLTPCKPVTSQADINALGPDDCVAADNPAWSPDSKWIIFDTNHPGIWMIDLNGQNAQQLYSQSRGTERVPLKFSN